MRISTRSRYGTRMMLDIAMHSQDGPVRIQDVAERQGLSVKYLEKLIRVLKDAGYIASKRGPKGGHMPAKDLSEITVGSVVRHLEGDDKLVECSSDESSCINKPQCLTRRVWAAAADAMFERLDTITFADLMDEMRRMNSDSPTTPDILPELTKGTPRDKEEDTAKQMAAAYLHP